MLVKKVVMLNALGNDILSVRIAVFFMFIVEFIFIVECFFLMQLVLFIFINKKLKLQLPIFRCKTSDVIAHDNNFFFYFLDIICPK